jgi:hypothetical protein
MKRPPRTVARLITFAQSLLFRAQGSRIANPRYVLTLPTPQTAVDIFKGHWICSFPEPLAHLQAGNKPLFRDEKIYWMLDRINGIAGKTVLELGPLEGAHSYLLEQAGAASITAIEADSHAYLKCLISKELLHLQRVQFLCGDCLEYLRAECESTFDVCLASGVLYHMRNPVELIALLTRRCTGYLYLWTHYYDHAVVSQNPWLATKHIRNHSAVYAGFEHSLYRYEYQEAKYSRVFSGAGTRYSHWLNRQDLLGCLEHFGFGNVQVGFDDPDHPGGPSLALIATRKN